MPLPNPRKKEKRSEFVSRCVSELTTKEEFKDSKQRVAVCYDIFKKKESEASIVIGEGDDTQLFFEESEANGRPSNPNYKQDNDLLPKGHPRAS